MSVIPALKRLTQKGCKFQVSVRFITALGARVGKLRIVSSLCGTGQTEYPHTKEWD